MTLAVDSGWDPDFSRVARCCSCVGRVKAVSLAMQQAFPVPLTRPGMQAPCHLPLPLPPASRRLPCKSRAARPPTSSPRSVPQKSTKRPCPSSPPIRNPPSTTGGTGGTGGTRAQWHVTCTVRQGARHAMPMPVGPRSVVFHPRPMTENARPSTRKNNSGTLLAYIDKRPTTWLHDAIGTGSAGPGPVCPPLWGVQTRISRVEYSVPYSST